MATLAELGREKYVSLTTFRRDGTPVSTPVWTVAQDDRLLVWTGASTWKVKRIRRDPHVRVAACNATGKVHGEPVDARATIVDDTETVHRLLASKYGLTYRALRSYNALVRRLRRRPAEQSVTISITSD